MPLGKGEGEVPQWICLFNNIALVFSDDGAKFNGHVIRQRCYFCQGYLRGGLDSRSTLIFMICGRAIFV